MSDEEDENPSFSASLGEGAGAIVWIVVLFAIVAALAYAVTALLR